MIILLADTIIFNKILKSVITKYEITMNGHISKYWFDRSNNHQ